MNRPKETVVKKVKREAYVNATLRANILSTERFFAKSAALRALENSLNELLRRGPQFWHY